MSLYIFASTYGSGCYTSNVYNNATMCTGTSTVSHSSTSTGIYASEYKYLTPLSLESLARSTIRRLWMPCRCQSG